jgi:hypothetical protein
VQFEESIDPSIHPNGSMTKQRAFSCNYEQVTTYKNY